MTFNSGRVLRPYMLRIIRPSARCLQVGLRCLALRSTSQVSHPMRFRSCKIWASLWSMASFISLCFFRLVLIAERALALSSCMVRAPATTMQFRTQKFLFSLEPVSQRVPIRRLTSSNAALSTHLPLCRIALLPEKEPSSCLFKISSFRWKISSTWQQKHHSHLYLSDNSYPLAPLLMVLVHLVRWLASCWSPTRGHWCYYSRLLPRIH